MNEVHEFPDETRERLDEAIAQHPALWSALGQAWENRRLSEWQNGYYQGLRASLSIVGQFDHCAIERKLVADFE